MPGCSTTGLFGKVGKKSGGEEGHCNLKDMRTSSKNGKGYLCGGIARK